jgi:hypothetical protein
MTTPNLLTTHEKRTLRQIKTLGGESYADTYLVTALSFRDKLLTLTYNGYGLNVITNLFQFPDGRIIKLKPIETKIMEYVFVKSKDDKPALIVDLYDHVYAKSILNDILKRRKEESAKYEPPVKPVLTIDYIPTCDMFPQSIHTYLSWLRKKVPQLVSVPDDSDKAKRRRILKLI